MASFGPNYYGSPEGMQRLRARDSYWKYLYLDRSLYRPDDRVNFWGLLKPREKGAPLPREVTAALTRWSWSEEAPIVTTPVQLEGFTFTGSLNLPNLSPGYYYLVIKDGEGSTLLEKGLEVATYTKPAYRLEVTPNKSLIRRGKRGMAGEGFLFEGPSFQSDFKLSFQSSGAVKTGAGRGPLSYIQTTSRGSTFQERYLSLHADFLKQERLGVRDR